MNRLENIPDVSLAGARILVVDDDVASCLFMERVLTAYGAAVTTAGCGKDALELFVRYRQDIVVTDIYMPGMDGLELAANIRKQDDLVHIVAATAANETDRLITAIRLGFNDYILKPVQVDKLLWAVKRGSEAISARRKFEDEQAKFQTVVESLGECLAIKDPNYRIVYQNRALTEKFGDLTGQSCFAIWGLDSPCHGCPTKITMADGLSHSECRTHSVNGKLITIESTASILKNSRGQVTGTVEILRDVSERVRAEQAMRDMAFHDHLTGLANRRLFEDRLEQAIATSRRHGTQFGLLTLDLDHFKEINDTFGHEAGDQVLQEAAERIRSCCKRDLDTISRQGGDEFCIIINDCKGRDELTLIAEKLLEQLAGPFIIEDGPVQVTTSIGVSMFPDNGQVLKELEIASDRAMYAAKKAGRNTYCFWEPFG